MKNPGTTILYDIFIVFLFLFPDTAGRRSTALHFASGYGRKDVVEYLLANGANISAKDDGGLNCAFGRAKGMKFFI
jgi:tankyrase